MKSPLVANVRASLVEQRMISPGDTVVVAVSGGPDSLCLLHVLKILRADLDITLHVAHLDHMLRGAESEAEAAFVAETAQDWGLPATLAAIDVQAIAQTEHINLHQAARDTRYRFLARLAQTIGAQAVAVAHNAEDQAETVLMHLLRGAGPAGLRGMRPIVPWEEWAAEDRRSTPPASLIRPLLQVTRAEIEVYCAVQGLQPRRDPTNADLSATRNRIRHDLLPRLIEYNPHIVAALSRTAAICAEEHAFVRAALAAIWPALTRVRAGAVDFDGGTWRRMHPALQREALRHAYALLGAGKTLELEQVEAARAAVARGVGVRATLPSALALTVGYGGSFTIGVAQTADGPQLSADELALPRPGQVALENGWTIEVTECSPPAPAPTSSWEVYLDAAALTGSLAARRRRPGDRFRPAGGRGSRPLQDMFVDAKVPRALRDAWPVVATPEAIVWVAGLRPAAGFVATPETERVVRLRISRTTDD